MTYEHHCEKVAPRARRAYVKAHSLRVVFSFSRLVPARVFELRPLYFRVEAPSAGCALRPLLGVPVHGQTDTRRASEGAGM